MKQRWYFTQLKLIVNQHQSAQVDNYFVDVQTANLISKFYERASHEMKKKMVKAKIENVALACWRAVSI